MVLIGVKPLNVIARTNVFHRNIRYHLSSLENNFPSTIQFLTFIEILIPII